jgi:hypothetical protein
MPIIPDTQEAEAGESMFWVSLGYIEGPCLKKTLLSMFSYYK